LKTGNRAKTTSRRLSISEAHAKAPWSAGIVRELREVFGDVEVLMVNEGEIIFDKRKHEADS
jgi:hypothetical protein